MKEIEQKGNNKVTGSTLSKYFGARIEDTEALFFERAKGRQLAWLLVSDIVPLEDNKKLIVTIIYRYANYIKGGKEKMEIRAGKMIEVKLENGIASLYDKRSFQLIAQLRYNANMSPLETMAFISSVVEDYEKYLKLVNKYFYG